MGSIHAAGLGSLSVTCLRGKGLAASVGLGCPCQPAVSAGLQAPTVCLLLGPEKP